MEGTSTNSTPGSIVKPGLHLLARLVTWVSEEGAWKVWEAFKSWGAKTELSVFLSFGLIQWCARGAHINWASCSSSL